MYKITKIFVHIQARNILFEYKTIFIHIRNLIIIFINHFFEHSFLYS